MAGALGTTSPPCDFFISYTRVDQDWAEKIAWWLEAAGYTVLIQAWDFRPGHNFLLMMHHGSRAKHTIAVLSQAYLEASHCQQEWAAVVAEDPKGELRKLIPVRVQHCQPDGMLRAINYLDLVGSSESKAHDALLGAIPDRAKPPKEPPFPGGAPRVNNSTGLTLTSEGHSNV